MRAKILFRWRRIATVILSAGILIGGLSSGTPAVASVAPVPSPSATVTPASTDPGPGDAPSCGDTVYLSGVKKTQPIPTDGIYYYEFKVVGVDLSKWLGATGLGLMDIWIHDHNYDLRHVGPYNATGSGGARSPALGAWYVPGSTKPYVVVEIEKPSGYALCYEKLPIS